MAGSPSKQSKLTFRIFHPEFIPYYTYHLVNILAWAHCCNANTQAIVHPWLAKHSFRSMWFDQYTKFKFGRVCRQSFFLSRRKHYTSRHHCYHCLRLCLFARSLPQQQPMHSMPCSHVQVSNRQHNMPWLSKRLNGIAGKFCAVYVFVLSRFWLQCRHLCCMLSGQIQVVSCQHRLSELSTSFQYN